MNCPKCRENAERESQWKQGHYEQACAMARLSEENAKLRALILLVDPAVSSEEMNSLSAKQWAEFQRWQGARQKVEHIDQRSTESIDQDPSRSIDEHKSSACNTTSDTIVLLHAQQVSKYEQFVEDSIRDNAQHESQVPRRREEAGGAAIPPRVAATGDVDARPPASALTAESESDHE